MTSFVMGSEGLKVLLRQVAFIHGGDQVVEGLREGTSGRSAKLEVFLVVVSSISFRYIGCYGSRGPSYLVRKRIAFIRGECFPKRRDPHPKLPGLLITLQLLKGFHWLLRFGCWFVIPLTLRQAQDLWAQG